MLNPIYIDNLIQTALLEDISYLDTTTDYLIPEQQQSQAHFLAKADGVLCGIAIAMRVFTFLQPDVMTEIYKQDGNQLKKGDVIAKISGSTRALLKGERTALNLLQHLSGIATATHQAVLLTSGTKASITDTRKTLPGLRPLQNTRL